MWSSLATFRGLLIKDVLFSGPRSLSLSISCLREILVSRDQIANTQWITEKKREFQKNIYFCITDYMKAFDCVNHNKLWKILQEMGIPHHLTCLLRNLYVGQEATVELDIEQWTGSKLGKEYVKAVYCHPAYLTCMQST